MKKIIIIVVVLIVVIGTAALIFSNKSKANAANDSYVASNMDTTTVTRENLEKSITIKGKVSSFESDFVKYVAPIKVDEVYVKAGDQVSVDQKLIKVNDENLNEYIDNFIKQLNNQLKQYERIDKKKYDYIKVYAKDDGRVSYNDIKKGEKVDDLLKNGELLTVKTDDGEYGYGKEYSGAIISSITKKAVMNAKVKKGDLIFTVKTKDDAIEKKNKEIERSQEKLDNLLALKENPYITMNEEGFVKEVFVKGGSEYGTEVNLIEYYAKDDLCAKISVSKQDIKDLSLGLPAKIEVDSNVLDGEIKHINYISDENGDFDVSVKLFLDAKDKEVQVFPGLDAKVTFIFEKSENAIVVPSDTIKNDDKGFYVMIFTADLEALNSYSVEGFPYEKRYIEKGITTPTKTEVISGLDEGDIVVYVGDESEEYEEVMVFLERAYMTGLISVKDLHKEYRMSDVCVKALNGVDIDIRKSEFVALTGSSGSGKSTLMNILGCLDIPTSGEYYLNGEDISKATDAQLAEIRNKNLGFVFQDFNLITNMSAIENVALPYKYAKMSSANSLKKAKEALERVGLGDRVHHKPYELSGGQQQRVAFARALLCDPPILLADEPTGNLDSKTTIEILDLICELNNNGTTIVMVTHERDVAEIAKREIVLLDGEIKEEVLR